MRGWKILQRKLTIAPHITNRNFLLCWFELKANFDVVPSLSEGNATTRSH